MKKILISISIISVVAVIITGATVAYFSDSEISTGNTFTAGTLDLLVDNTCHYHQKECQWDELAQKYFWAGTSEECFCTWSEKNLAAGDLFFNFTDVKPGDDGEDTISLRVNDNDAWACVTISPLANDDNLCSEPEREAETAAYGAGNETCGPLGGGELQDYLYFTVWADYDCDNGQDVNEPVLIDNKKASDVPLSGITLPIADSTYNAFTGTPGPLIGGQKYCLAVFWNIPFCAGNIIQTDSVKGDISFFAEQARNNASFVCGQ